LNLLSSVPTKKKKKLRNYKTFILVTSIFLLIIALFGISGLYYNASQMAPTIIMVNQSENNSSTYGTYPEKNTTIKINSQDNQKNPQSDQDSQNKKTNKKSDSNENRPKNST